MVVLEWGERSQKEGLPKSKKCKQDEGREGGFQILVLLWERND